MRLTHRLVLYTALLTSAVVLVLGVAIERRVTERMRVADQQNPERSSRDTLQRVRGDIVVAGAVVLLLGLMAATLTARYVARPIEELRDDARTLAEGGTLRRSTPLGGGEVADVSDALRRITAQSATRLEALRTEEALLVALTESLNEGVIAVDAWQRVVRINQTARHILRLNEPVPFPADYLPRDHTMRDALSAVLRGEEALPSELRVDERTISLTARPLPDGGAILALYDLTPFRRLEAVRRDFVANVSHELRTPLTIIAGFVETLADDELPADLRRQFLGMTAANVGRMQRIVDDLLDLSRIESGGWLPNPGELDVRALTSEIASPLRDQATAKGVALEVTIGADIRTVYADPTAARQILANLTENALRHTTSGTVTLFATRDTDGIWLGVRDTGSGISEAHLPRIFERFYRADPGRSREAGGTGLGLAIVRHLAEAHGGRVRAESTVGSGTTIAALFPVAGECSGD